MVELSRLETRGYQCATTVLGGSVPALSILEGRFPSTKGRLGGRDGEVRFRNEPAAGQK